MGDNKKGNVGFDGFLNRFSDILDKLNDLSQTQEIWSKTTEFSKAKDDLKGVFGFSLKVGLGDQKPRVEPFGNIRRDKETGKSVVQEIREPIADVFEETDHTLVVIEMPGISESDIKLDVKDDLINLYAENGEKKYQKEVLLPRAYPKQNMTMSCNNGILEIKCRD